MVANKRRWHKTSEWRKSLWNWETLTTNSTSASRLATCEFHLWISYSTDNEHCTNALSLSLVLMFIFSIFFWVVVNWKVSWVESMCILCLAPVSLLFASPAVEVEIMHSRCFIFVVVVAFSLSRHRFLSCSYQHKPMRRAHRISTLYFPHATFARVICPCVSANSLLPFSDMHTMAFVCKCLPNWICLHLSLNIVDFYALF